MKSSKKNMNQVNRSKQSAYGDSEKKGSMAGARARNVAASDAVSSHSSVSKSVASKSHSSAFNSDPEDKDFVVEKKSTGSRGGAKEKDGADDIDLDFETRDIPFQIKTEHAYEVLKQDYVNRKNNQQHHHGAAFGKHPKFLELKEQLMEIEEEIKKEEKKETILINKVNYYLTTRTDEEASVNFRLLLHDPHDLMEAIEERRNLAAGPQGPSARTSNKSGHSGKFN